MRQRLAETAAPEDPTTLFEDDLMPHVRRHLERVPPSKQPQRERELFALWLEKGPTEE